MRVSLAAGPVWLVLWFKKDYKYIRSWPAANKESASSIIVIPKSASGLCIIPIGTWKKWKLTVAANQGVVGLLRTEKRVAEGPQGARGKAGSHLNSWHCKFV